MKQKILLCGSNQAVISDFFDHADEFRCISTSDRYEDVSNHLDFCRPDVFVFCANNEDRETILRMKTVKEKVKNSVPFIYVATQPEIDACIGIDPKVMDYFIARPLAISGIAEKLEKYLEEWYADREESQKNDYIITPVGEDSGAGSQVTDLKKRFEVLEEATKDILAETPRKHILVVDDDPVMLKLVKRYLDKEYQIGTATSGKLAMRFLNNRTTDLILLDYEMPEEDGTEVLKKLRDNPKTAQTPVIFLTSIADGQKISKALELKPQGYLLKPIDNEKLHEAIGKIFR